MAQPINEATFTEREREQGAAKLVKLWEAIRDDAHVTVLNLLGQCDADEPNEDGQTALMYAAALGHSHSMGRILDARRQPNIFKQDKHGRTALHWAVEANSEQCVGRLTGVSVSRREQGCVLVEDDEGRSPLDMAVDAGRYQLVAKMLRGRYLDDAGKLVREQIIPRMEHDPFSLVACLAGRETLVDEVRSRVADLNPDARDWRNRSALHFAALAGAHEAIERMLAAGHDPDALDDDMATPLILCAQGPEDFRGDWTAWVETAKALLPASDAHWSDRKGKTAFMHAAEKLSRPMIDALLPYSYLHAWDNNEQTAGNLGMRQANGANAAAATYVIERTKPHVYQRRNAIKDAQGRKFRRAALQGDDAILRSMLRGEEKRKQQGIVYDELSFKPTEMPLVHRPDQHGSDALMIAARAGNTSCVAILLDACSDGLARDGRGASALRCAVRAQSLECVRLLIPRSHVDSKDRDGKLILSEWGASQNKEIFQELLGASRFSGVERDA